MATSPQQKTSRPTLQAAVPQLAVNDLSEALAYFQNVLGFSLAWQWGEPPHMASVCRDMIEVNLCWTAMAPPAPATVYFQMAGVDAYHDEISRAGATVTVPIADRVYGMRDFRIADPSGNQLSFGEIMAA